MESLQTFLGVILSIGGKNFDSFGKNYAFGK